MPHTDATREGITRILADYQYVEGARDVVSYLQSKGYVLVLISGSNDILVSLVARELGIKYFKANNTFAFDEQGNLTGVHTDGSDIHAKLRYLEAFAELLNIPLEACACVGDGANDIEMFRKTRHGVTVKGSKIESEAWKVVRSLQELSTIFP